MEIKRKIFNNILQSFHLWNILQIKILEMWNLIDLIDFRQNIITFWNGLRDGMLNEPNIQEMLSSPDWALPHSAVFSN